MKLSQAQLSEIRAVLEKTSLWSDELNRSLEEIQKTINKKVFWFIEIEKIPNDIINIEDTRLFKSLVKLFLRYKTNKKYNFEYKDIFVSNEMFDKFKKFCFSQSLYWKLQINNSDNELLERSKIEALFDDFENRHWYQVKNSTKYYDEIINRLWLDKHDLWTRRQMLKFNTAYHLIKQVFSWQEREWIDDFWKSERSFEHLRWTMEIVLRELPNPNINKIIIALLHDAVEDIPWITFEMLENVFWKEIADWVKELTKKDWKEFLNKEELLELKELEKWISKDEIKILRKNNKEYIKLIKKWKERRNEDYFWNLKNLEEDKLYVKFADRIHNLRTLKWMPMTKIVKKIIETEKYFLDVALKEKVRTNWECEAYDLMIFEINKLLEDDDIKFLYDLVKQGRADIVY